jgi:hypothetical protein
MFVNCITIPWRCAVVAVLVYVPATMFGQTPPLEVRTYYSKDGQIFRVNSIGQILGWDDPRRCDDPHSPKCSKIGFEFRGRDRNNKDKPVRLYTGGFQPVKAGFTGKTPPDGTTIDADGTLTVETESETLINEVPLQVQQTVQWQPRKRQIGSRIRVKKPRKKYGSKDYDPPEWERALVEGKWMGGYGCNCDPPGPFESPRDEGDALIFEGPPPRSSH